MQKNLSLNLGLGPPNWLKPCEAHYFYFAAALGIIGFAVIRLAFLLGPGINLAGVRFFFAMSVAAFQRLRAPSIVLLHLPRLDGLEMWSHIRASERLKRPPVIILTSSLEPEPSSA